MSASAIQALVDKLTKARGAYYNGTPTMSDNEFDMLEDQLRDLDPGNAFFSQVGAEVPSGGWSKVKHKIPMSSLNKAQDESDLRKWSGLSLRMTHAQLADKGGLIWVEKLDGISISLRYDNGTLTKQ